MIASQRILKPTKKITKTSKIKVMKANEICSFSTLNPRLPGIELVIMFRIATNRKNTMKRKINIFKPLSI
jgi:hypothetical protein